MDDSYTLMVIDKHGVTTAETRGLDMYQYQYEDLYDAQYDVYKEDVQYVDSCITSLIEELYCSKTLNKQSIADALSIIALEITPAENGYFAAKDINLQYANSNASFLESWLDALDPITGDLNYMRLSNPACGQPKKELEKFDDVFSALNTIIFQLTTLTPFDDNKLAGALVFLSDRYGINCEDAKLYQPNVKRD